VHLREDRRHIQDADVPALLAVVRTKVNLEMAVTPEMVAIACRLKPADACLVPERREEVTTEGGLDVAGNAAAVRDAVRRLQDSGVRVSLFIDADPVQVDASGASGADAVEIHTGRYADAADGGARRAELERVRAGVARARRRTDRQRRPRPHLDNVEPIAALPQVAELNIGHSIVARALFVGMEEATREMKALIVRGRG
jgi:pyridoxine 5-phosphate synthase